jgi:hypothetical protein
LFCDEPAQLLQSGEVNSARTTPPFIEIEVELPPGVTGELALPGGGRRQLTAGKHQEL